MDTFMTFISSGAYPGKRESDRDSVHNNDHGSGNSNSNSFGVRMEEKTPKDRQTDGALDDGEIARQILEDDVLNEFLNPQCFQQPSDILDMIDNAQESIGNDTVGNGNGNAEPALVGSGEYTSNPVMPDNRMFNPSDELKRYESSKKELMKVKFGLSQDAKYIHDSNIGFSYTRAPCVNNPDDAEVTTTLLPAEYQESFLRDEQSFPYHVKIADLPSHSRVETQIKLELSISPPPPQFLLHIPRDSITKPKFTLADNDLPESIQDHLLYLDLFIVGSQTSNAKDGRVRSCNVCKRCMRRELKRASRRKAGLVDDSSNWDINLPKRAIIINSKEIVSFPAPNGNTNERKIELLSRIVCYCRHHQELDGFQILIFIKNKDGVVVGKTISTPILIMDRKKSLKSSMERNKENVSNQENGSDLYTKSSTMNKKNSSITSNNSNGDSSAELSVPTSTTTMNSVTNNNMINGGSSILNSSSSVTNMNSMNILASNGNKPQSGVFSSIFSFDPSNLLGDESSRQVKRQKRPWSPSESSTYFETINQQRGIPSSGMDSKKISVKREAISPSSSDAVSPHNHLFSSATSAFSTTPEKEYREAATNLSPPGNGMLIDQNNNLLSANNSIDAGMNVDMGIGIDMNMNVNNEDCPTIRRIIPAQGPVRGGIEITLLGSNFRPGLIVKFGRNIALATQCWSDSTIVTYLPPASQAGPVLVTFEDANYDFTNSSAHQIFTYTDDTDRQLIELALQIVGLKMNGKLEDAKNIAKRIVGSNQVDSSSQQQQQQQQISPNSTMNLADVPLNQQLQLNWMAVASNKIKELSKSTLNHEEILIKFLSMIKIPNSLISSPNWAVCNAEGQTMLHLACLKNYSKLCQFLMKNGSRVDYKDKNGFSPLHFAFINGNRKIINLLSKFKANSSTKLDNGVLLSDIADSNVLDLIHPSRRSSTSSSDINFYDDDDDDNDKLDYSFDADLENDTDLSYNNEMEELDDYQLSYKTHRHRSRRSVHHQKSKRPSTEDQDDDSEFEADNEDDTDSISDKVQQHGNREKNATSRDDKQTNSFGFNLWIAMKEAIKNKMVEISVGQEKHKKKGHERHGSKKQLVGFNGKGLGRGEQQEESDVESNRDNSSDDRLPSYDDLFPQGTSLRSLINFRGHGDDEQDGQKKVTQTGRAKESTLTTNSCDVINPDGDVGDDDDADRDVDILAMNLRTSINSDTKLMFFWLPCMLMLLLIVIGNNLNIITIQRFQFFSYFLEKVREIVGSFMLGKDRFTNLINENINYGRERMENLINDVNDAMMTAVAGVGR